MRAAGVAAMLLSLSACAGSEANATMRMPDWNGPAVHCRHQLDGALQIEMVVPTGGHQLRLADVVLHDATAMVRVDYAPPTGDMVPQVITTLRVEVPAASLGDASVVLVEVSVAGGARTKLAVATARPAR